jgi:hypothetical protein
VDFSLAFLVTFFAIRRRLEECSSEPEPEMLLTTIEIDEWSWDKDWIKFAASDEGECRH